MSESGRVTPGPRGWPFLPGSRGAVQGGDDASTLEEAIERAADREELLLQALRIAGVGGWEFDPAGGTLSWSEETFRIFGVDPETVEPTSELFYDLVHPDDRDRMFAEQIHSFEAGATFDQEYRIVRPDGALRHLISRAQVVPRGRDRQNRFLGVVQDVTERRSIEQTLEEERQVAQKLQADLIHISRVSAMGALGSALAHELNQPLAAIANYTAVLRRGGAATDQAPQAVKAIEDNARRAGEIIRRLRQMTTRGEVRTMPVELAAAIVEAADLARTGAAVSIDYDFEPGLSVEADRIQLQQVIVNLVRNAIDAMAGQDREQRIAITARSEGDRATIAVSDTGPGIAEPLLATVFESFVTSKSGGMGVGLAISRTIAEAHGGRLWAENRQGGGAAFHLELPCRAPA